MEERSASTYRPATSGDVQNARGLRKRDLEQFECRYRQTCFTMLKWLLAIAFVGFGTLTVLLAMGFGWLDF